MNYYLNVSLIGLSMKNDRCQDVTVPLITFVLELIFNIQSYAIFFTLQETCGIWFFFFSNNSSLFGIWFLKNIFSKISFKYCLSLLKTDFLQLPIIHGIS